MVYKVEAIPVTYFFNKRSDTSRGSMLLKVVSDFSLKGWFEEDDSADDPFSMSPRLKEWGSDVIRDDHVAN